MQVIAEPRRRQILRLVWHEEMAAGDIAEQIEISFPAVSQHLRTLRDAGAVRTRRDGRRRYYQADRDALGAFRAALEQMWALDLGCLAAAAEAAHAGSDAGPTLTQATTTGGAQLAVAVTARDVKAYGMAHAELQCLAAQRAMPMAQSSKTRFAALNTPPTSIHVAMTPWSGPGVAHGNPPVPAL